MVRALKLCLIGLCLSAAGMAMAEQPLRLVVPYPSGGILDVQARLVAPGMKRHLRREVIVDNIAGAAGAIGLQHVLAAGDGAELAVGTDSDVVLAPLFNPELKYRPEQFQLLSVLGSAPMAFVARPGFDAAALRRLVGGNVQGEGELRLASYGVGSNAHLVAHDFARRLRLRWLHVPYRGSAPLMQDLMGGTVDAAFLPLAGGIPDMVRSGKVQLLGVASARRATGFGDVPTFEEMGLAGFQHRSWSALLMPAAAAQARVAALRDAAVAVAADAQVRGGLEGLGLTPVHLPTREAAQAFFDAEVARYAGLLSSLSAEPRGGGVP